MQRDDEIRAIREELARLRAQMDRLDGRLTELAAQQPPEEPEPAEPKHTVMPPPLAKEETAPPAPPVVEPPRPAPAPAVKGPSIQERVLQFLRKASGADPSAGWEVLLGTYVLARIGVVLLAIALVLFLGLAVQRWGHLWTPPWRVATAYAASALLLGGAWRLERRYAAYSRVLYGGGFAMLYFTSFATHYVGYARIFDTQEPALVLLTGVVLVWAAAAQWRQSRTMAFIATVLGHFTVALSIYTMELPSKWAIAGLVALAAGSAFFLLRNRWYYIALAGIVGSYGNYCAWLFETPASTQLLDFWIAMGVLSLLFAIFALAELFGPDRLRRQQMPLWYRSIFVTLNSLGFLGVGSLLVQGFEPYRENHDIFRLAFALALIVLALAYLNFRKRDPLYNVYLAKGVSVATLGLAARYSGDTLTAWFAVEMAVLLWSSRRTGLVMTRLLGMAAAPLACIHYIHSAAYTGHVPYASADYPAHATAAAVAVLAFLASGALFERTDWSVRSWVLPWRRNDFSRLLEGLSLAWPDAEEPGQTRPWPIGHVLAITGALLLIFSGLVVIEDGHHLAVYGVVSLAVALLAWPLRSRALGAASLVAFVIAAASGTAYGVQGYWEVYWAWPLLGVAALAAVAFLSEQRYVGGRYAWHYHQHPTSPYLMYLLTGWVGLLIVWYEFESIPGAGTAAILACAACGLALVLHPHALASASVLLYAGAVFRWTFTGSETAFGPWDVVGLGIILAGFAGDHFCSSIKLVRTGRWFLPFAMIASIRIVPDWLDRLYYEDYSLFAIAVIGWAFLAYGALLRTRTAVVLSLIVTGLVSLIAAIAPIAMANWATPALILAYAGPAAYWIAAERLAAFKFDGAAATRRGIAPVALATLLLVMMLARIQLLEEYFLTIAWASLAVFLFIISLPFKQGLYRLAGFCVFVLALLRVFFVDLSELEGFYRVGAFAVFGLILLGVGLAYFKAADIIKKAQEGETTE